MTLSTPRVTSRSKTIHRKWRASQEVWSTCQYYLVINLVAALASPNYLALADLWGRRHAEVVLCTRTQMVEQFTLELRAALATWLAPPFSGREHATTTT